MNREPEGGTGDVVAARKPGTTCPFLETVSEASPSSTNHKAHICLSRTSDPITISDRYVDTYCLSDQHVSCSLFIHADDEAKLRALRAREQRRTAQVTAEPADDSVTKTHVVASQDPPQHHPEIDDTVQPESPHREPWAVQPVVNHPIDAMEAEEVAQRDRPLFTAIAVEPDSPVTESGDGVGQDVSSYPDEQVPPLEQAVQRGDKQAEDVAEGDPLAPAETMAQTMAMDVEPGARAATPELTDEGRAEVEPVVSEGPIPIAPELVDVERPPSTVSEPAMVEVEPVALGLPEERPVETVPEPLAEAEPVPIVPRVAGPEPVLSEPLQPGPGELDLDAPETESLLKGDERQSPVRPVREAAPEATAAAVDHETVPDMVEEAPGETITAEPPVREIDRAQTAPEGPKAQTADRDTITPETITREATVAASVDQAEVGPLPVHQMPDRATSVHKLPVKQGTRRSPALLFLCAAVVILALMVAGTALLVQQRTHTASRPVPLQKTAPGPAQSWSFTSVRQSADQVILTFGNQNKVPVDAQVISLGHGARRPILVHIPASSGTELSLDSQTAGAPLTVRASAPIVAARTVIRGSTTKFTYGLPGR